MKARRISIATAALMIVSAGQAPADEAVLKKSDCHECHNMDKKGIGPSFQDIAARYRGNAAARNALIETMKRGGKGNWTDTAGVPMPPYSPRLSDDEIRRIVDWVLGL